MQNFHDSPHRRHNPLTGEWVLVSPHRMMRPWQGQKETEGNKVLPEHDSNCYLCPGNERTDGIKNPKKGGSKRRMKTNKRRLKEVKSSIRDLRIERLKKIGNKRAQDNLKSAIAGLKEKKKQLKNK